MPDLPLMAATNAADEPLIAAGFTPLPSLGRGFATASVADVNTEVGTQDRLVLSDIEARLTEEVRGLIAALFQFGSRAQLIGEELPDRAHFCKAVTAFFALFGLQHAHALSQGLDTPIFFDDGAEYLRKLNLSLGDLIREVDFDGRRFLAIAFVDQKPREFCCTRNAGDKR